MKRSALALAAVAAVFLCACGSKELSRSKAAQEITKARFKTEKVSYFEIGLGHTYGCQGAVFESLGKAGILKTSNISSNNLGTSCDAVLTELGSQLLKTEKGWTTGNGGIRMPVAHAEFGEVTGIERPMPTIAIVEYTWHWVPNRAGIPVGDATPKTEHAEFNLFDDGWRLTH
jgi:hypothetical protein